MISVVVSQNSKTYNIKQTNDITITQIKIINVVITIIT